MPQPEIDIFVKCFVVARRARGHSQQMIIQLFQIDNEIRRKKSNHEKEVTLSILYFVTCKSFVSDFFIFEKAFVFYEKFLLSEENTFAIFRFSIFQGRNFGKNEQKSRKSRNVLPTKISAPKVVERIFPPLHLNFGVKLLCVCDLLWFFL